MKHKKKKKVCELNAEKRNPSMRTGDGGGTLFITPAVHFVLKNDECVVGG